MKLFQGMLALCFLAVAWQPHANSTDVSQQKTKTKVQKRVFCCSRLVDLRVRNPLTWHPGVSSKSKEIIFQLPFQQIGTETVKKKRKTAQTSEREREMHCLLLVATPLEWQNGVIPSTSRLPGPQNFEASRASGVRLAGRVRWAGKAARGSRRGVEARQARPAVLLPATLIGHGFAALPPWKGTSGKRSQKERFGNSFVQAGLEVKGGSSSTSISSLRVPSLERWANPLEQTAWFLKGTMGGKRMGNQPFQALEWFGLVVRSLEARVPFNPQTTDPNHQLRAGRLTNLGAFRHLPDEWMYPKMKHAPSLWALGEIDEHMAVQK